MTAKMWIVRDGETDIYLFCRNKEHAISVLDEITDGIKYKVKTGELDHDQADVLIACTYMISGQRSARMELNVSDVAIRDIYHRVYQYPCPEVFSFKKEYCHDRYQGLTRMYGALLMNGEREKVYHDIYYV